MMVVLGYAAYTFAVGAFAAWGPSFFVRIHGMKLEVADRFFGIMLVLTGLTGTFTGGFLSSWWHKRNRAGYAWTLGLSVLVGAPLTAAAFTVADKHVSQVFLASSMFFIFFCTGPVNTLILDSVPANLHASAMAVSLFAIHLLGDWKSSEIVGHYSDRWGLASAVLILPAALLVCALLWTALALAMRKNGAASQG
jgi:hypothetical protein